MKLAEKGRGFVSPNPVVGAVLVRKGKIIAQDWHRKFGEGHAERNLLSKLKGKILPSDVLVVTLEPCVHRNKKTPPCTDIILEKKVKHVVVGLLDPNPEVSGKGIQVLKNAGVKVSVIASEAKQSLRWQNRFFFTWIQKRRPWVALKIAQSLDGRITFDRGQQLWLTGKKAKEHVQKMRAAFDAILVGVKTVMVDDPGLTTPPTPLLGRSGEKSTQSKVVVLDAALSTPLSSHVVRPGTIIFCGPQFRRRKTKKEQLEAKGCIVLAADTDDQGYLNLHEVLSELAARNIASVYVEGGPAVWSSFLRQGLADELMIYFAPKLLGDGVQTFENTPPTRPPSAPPSATADRWQGGRFAVERGVRFRELKILGDDVFWNGYFY